MMSFERWFGPRVLLFGVALSIGLLPAAPHAEEVLSTPQKVIRDTAEQLQRNLQKPDVKNDFAKATAFVDTVLESHVDFDRVSVLVLGKYWKTASTEQKARFKTEFRRLLVRTYTTAFTEYSDWNIRYLPSQDSSEDKTMVRTEILQSNGPPVAVNYRMINNKGTWKVYDVLIEGISLLQNYRTSFTNQIAEGGSVEQLIKDLTARNDSAHKEPLEGGSAQGS
jgi:phospholipid transport system substrate-binding protein